jgi:hypothetical protein
VQKCFEIHHSSPAETIAVTWLCWTNIPTKKSPFFPSVAAQLNYDRSKLLCTAP